MTSSEIQTTPRRRQPRLPIEVRRQQVLDAALRIISRQGYGAANMEAIARETGVAKTVVYDAYPTRGQLLRALMEREEQRAMDSIALALPGVGQDFDPDRTVRDWAQRSLSAIREHPETWALVLRDSAETPEIVREHVQAGREQVLGALRALVELAVADRPELARLDPDLSARALLAVAEQAATLVLAHPEAYTPERYAEFAAQLTRLLLP